jgi:hypothetical protein
MRVAYDTRIVPQDELEGLTGNPNATITEQECAETCVALQRTLAPWYVGIGGVVGLTAGATTGALLGYWLGKRAAQKKERGRHGGDV